MGLDVPAGSAEDAAAAQAAHPGGGDAARFARLTPGLDALDEAAREVHRYGGWAMQDDVLPPSLTPVVLAGAVDFSRDSITPAAAAYALLSGDAAPLAALLRASPASGVDQGRQSTACQSCRPRARRLWSTPEACEARSRAASGAASPLSRA